MRARALMKKKSSISKSRWSICTKELRISKSKSNAIRTFKCLNMARRKSYGKYLLTDHSLIASSMCIPLHSQSSNAKRLDIYDQCKKSVHEWLGRWKIVFPGLCCHIITWSLANEQRFLFIVFSPGIVVVSHFVSCSLNWNRKFVRWKKVYNFTVNKSNNFMARVYFSIWLIIFSLRF